jgi:UDP-glucuronate decarboxylase
MLVQKIFDKKNVLVTGGAGFIGSHLCDELIKTNKVICVDNFLSGNERNIDHLLSNPDFIFIRHDMTEPLDLLALPELERFKIKFQGVQEIYNLACPMSPVDFLDNRLANLLANSAAVFQALEMARQYQAKLMHFSSSVVYGSREQHSGQKVAENDLGLVDQLSDRACYDEGKRFAETMINTYRQFHGVNAKMVRLFRIYGPRLPINQGHMIPDFIINALDGKDLMINGDQNFSSSLCYVSDAVDGVIKLMQSDLSGPVNIGSEVDVKIAEVAAQIIQKTNSKSKVTYNDDLLFMSQLNLPDTHLAREQLGWMPVVTLEHGLDKTIEDLRSSKSLKKLPTSW